MMGNEKVWQSMCMNSGTIFLTICKGRYFKNYGMCWKKKIHWVWLL